MAAVAFERVLWTDDRAVALQRILEEDLLLMGEIEAIAARGGARRVILQTGDQQPEAVALYSKLGYRRIPVYEPYASAIPFSVCFEKPLR